MAMRIFFFVIAVFLLLTLLEDFLCLRKSIYLRHRQVSSVHTYVKLANGYVSLFLAIKRHCYLSPFWRAIF